jgi:hypothetical protein
MDAAFFASGSHYLPLFQMSDKIVCLRDRREADSPEFLESIIDILFRHVRTSPE